MRKLIAIILILIGFSAIAQTPPRTGYLVQPAKWKFVNPVWLDSGAYITKIVKTSGQNRYLVYDSLTGKIGYRYVSVDFSNYVPYTGATTNVNIGTYTYIGHSLKSDASDGVLIEAANGTDVGIFGAGNTANSSLYGGLTIGSLTSGNGTDSVVVVSSAGLLKKRPASAFGSTYTAGRGLTLNSSVFRLDTTQFYTWTNARTRWNSAPTATANYGVINFGSGPFDGVTSGYFVGPSSGTLMAGNLASGSTSDLLNLQVAGVSKISATSGGNFTASGTVAGNIVSASSYYIIGSTLYRNGLIYYNSTANGSITFGDHTGFTFTKGNNTQTLGIRATGTFDPTSGTGVFNGIQVDYTINQTGGANGITRGLYINPTLTATADFRAIEVTRGVVLMATYTFATLPTGIPTGSEVNISDSNTTTWGATIAGGGANNVKARYNGTNWTVIGI